MPPPTLLAQCRPQPADLGFDVDAFGLLGDERVSVEQLADQFDVLVMHRLTDDLSSAGANGSQQVRFSEGLLPDTESKVIYGQPASSTLTLRCDPRAYISTRPQQLKSVMEKKFSSRCPTAPGS